MSEKKICELSFDGMFVTMMMGRASSRPEKGEDVLVSFSRLIGREIQKNLSNVNDLYEKSVTIKITIDE